MYEMVHVMVDEIGLVLFFHKQMIGFDWFMVAYLVEMEPFSLAFSYLLWWRWMMVCLMGHPCNWDLVSC